MKQTITKRRQTRSSTRGKQSREAILDVAERHFGDFGYRGASIASIAEEVGLSDPGLLHHFRSKAGLLENLLEERFAVDEVKLREHDKLSLDELVGLVRDIIGENVNRRVGVKLLMVLFAESIAEDHPARGYFQARYEHVRTIFTKHLKDCQQAGEIRSDLEPQHLATALIALLDGLQMQWLLNDKIDMVSAVDAVLKVLQVGMSEAKSDH